MHKRAVRLIVTTVLIIGICMPIVNPPLAALADHIYDATDPGASLDLPMHLLDDINDAAGAVAAVEAAVAGMTAEQRQSATGIDLLTLFAEGAVAQASSVFVASSIIIDETQVRALDGRAHEIREAVERALSALGVEIQRDINADISFKAARHAQVRVTINPSAANTIADNVRITTQDYSMTFSNDAIKENAGDSPLTILITDIEAPICECGYDCDWDNCYCIHWEVPDIWSSAAMTEDRHTLTLCSLPSAQTQTYRAFRPNIRRLSSSTTYNVNFDKPLKEDIRISLPPAPGETTYQVILDSDGSVMGGKYNPVTNTVDAKINKGGTYTVRENRVNFNDISGKSREMQEAINVLASKGIINGTTATTFSPDGAINRAEIAALIVRTLSKLDPNADGGFNDVGRSDWFCGAVGSARRHGIVNGTSPTTFAPRNVIQKDQIVAICARTLRTEMRYRDPSNVSGILSAYTDASSIAQWGREDIALATRENLVVRRTDGNFNGSATMTRGDAAIILYRMFMKIW